MGFLDDVRNAGLSTQKKNTPRPAGDAVIIPLAAADGTTPYALEALNREVLNVATAPEGTRNHTLNTAAYNMAQLVAGGQIPPRDVYQALYQAARGVGLDEHETRATLASGLGAGQEQPRTAKPDPVGAWLDTMHAQTPTPAPPTPQNGPQPLGETPWPTNSTPATTEALPAPPAGQHTPAETSSATPNLPWMKPAAQSAATNSTKPGNASPLSAEPSTPPGSPDLSNGDSEAEAPAEVDRANATLADYMQQVPPELLTREIAGEMLKLRVREAAQSELKRQREGAPPVLYTLPDFLARPLPDAVYRMGALWPTGGRVVLAAQYKAGKSTAIGNALRALADGDPFLGRFDTEPAQNIVLIDNELDDRTLQRWLNDQGIENTRAIRLLPLRGHVAWFDLLDDNRLQEIAALIKGAEIVVLDCLRPVLDALGLSEDKDAGKFLDRFDQLLRLSGATEAIVVHHMGHSGNRSRGDSRILDWPDATWKMSREDSEDPASDRYFSAFGRDVTVDESLLQYDPETRHLTLLGGTRKAKRAEDLVGDIVRIIELHPEGPSGRDIEGMVVGKASDVRDALKAAVAQGLILKVPNHSRGGGYRYVLPMPHRTQPNTDPTNDDPTLPDTK